MMSYEVDSSKPRNIEERMEKGEFDNDKFEQKLFCCQREGRKQLE